MVNMIIIIDQPLMTNDYLGKWMPIYNIRGSVPAEVAEAAAARFLERTMSNSVVKGSKGLGVEEASSRRKKNEVNLELLRLWFN
ncbi:hypothetical protein TorRG33x02_296790 [Trema orientale]|uniref:Uncharacterized protein n=1 Tax=Trema orientale TaxID=63057 RepID=A0A2P5C5Q8_TREOI|nr:hypothetical protein TorRG33x02_296790 [Trema orientale]